MVENRNGALGQGYDSNSSFAMPGPRPSTEMEKLRKPFVDQIETDMGSSIRVTFFPGSLICQADRFLRHIALK